MVIPRENKLVRLYIQMTTTEKGGGKVSRISHTQNNHVLSQAARSPNDQPTNDPRISTENIGSIQT